MSITCLIVLVYEVYLKVQERYLIFILNPCHISNVFMILGGWLKFSKFGNFCALVCISFSFGGWIGILFAENEGLPLVEIIFYQIEHAFASWLGPLIFTLGGRYPLSYYLQWPFPLLSLAIFSVY